MSAQSMSPLLRILHLEDNPTDAELMRGMLEAAGVDCAIRRVETREAFQSALEREQFDLVISDFTLPSFDGLSALTICRHKKPELPFIFVSGTIGEDAAVESLKRGATDYVIKDRLSRLAASVERAVQEAQSRAERLQADEKIREQAALLDKARDAICVMDMEFTILYWNHGAERLYGWSVEEAVGQSAHDLLFRGNVSLLLDAVKQLIRQNEWQGELRKNSKDGRENVVESRWTLLRDALGRPKSILLIDSDITEKKQIEAQLFRTQRVQSIGAVAGGIAHDLNNMLAPILMVTELLRDELTSEQSRKMLDTAKASAQRGAEMVKQILAFARGAGGEPKTIQLKHLVNEMVRLIGDTFPRSIQVESRVDKELCPILGDAAQFNQVLLNLCVNARDAMPGGGTLQIGADNAVLEGKRTPMLPEPVSGKFVVLSVVDTGCGIPPELLGRIFEPFFTTKEPGKGTGLGLSTVLSIVKAHHGFVEVVSEVGKGTIFEVYLPATTKADSEVIKSAAPVMQMGRGEIILLVDDEAAVLEITKTTLEAFNYRVITAKDGAEALILYQQRVGEIDVVITDMEMPVMDGEALVREIRKTAPNAKVVCISGLEAEAKGMDMSHLKPQAFLTKPYSTETLLTALHQVVTS